MNFDFFSFIFGCLFEYLSWLSCEPIRRKWRKECKFNCSNCKVWDCNYWYCKEQKDKLQKKRG